MVGGPDVWMQQKARNSRYLEGAAGTNGKGSKHGRPEWEMSQAQRQNITGSTEKFPKHRQKHNGSQWERSKHREKHNRPLREMF